MPEELVRTAESALEEEDLPRAIELFNAAESAGLEPDRCAGGRWMAQMMCGNFAAAWQESDAIRLRGRPDPHRFWNGEDLQGRRLMLRCLHGFGDAVQMFRFLPRLRAVVKELVVEVPPRLLEIAPCFSGVDRVITWGELAPKQSPPWDVQMEIMELPYVLRVTAQGLEPTTGYLRLPPEVMAQTRNALGPKQRPRVGVTWSAGGWNPSRSVPLASMRPLLEVQGAEFWSLQGEPERAAWESVAGPMQRDAALCGDGILRLAAAIAHMDLVITVDTLAAHLAGALGVPCWMLLQRRADWRWMTARTDTPWYPLMRLWRQRNSGDWDELVDRVRIALGQKLRPGMTSLCPAGKEEGLLA